MLFGKKNKFHASARFQRRDFSKKVRVAREFKRTVRKRPETKLQKFLEQIGLGARLSQVGVAVAVLILLYLTFIPNFLFVRDVHVTGVNQDDSSVQNTTLDYLNKRSGLWPQRNIIFLNKAALAAYLTEHNSSVLKVNNVKKQLWNKLTVDVAARVEKFLLTTISGKFVVYNDGVVARQLGTDEKLPEGLFRIEVSTDDEVKNGNVFLSKEFAEKLQELSDNFKNVTGKPIDFVEIGLRSHETKPAEQEAGDQQVVSDKEELNLSQLTLFVKRDPNAKDGKTDFRVYIDTEQASITETENRAKLMFSELPPERFNYLYYLDLRFRDKAYVCLRNSACAKVLAPPVVAPVVPAQPTTPEATKPKN